MRQIVPISRRYRQHRKDRRKVSNRKKEEKKVVAAQLFNAEKKVLPPPTKRPVHRGFSRKVVAVVARLLNSKKGKRKTCCVKLGSYLFTKVRQTKKFDRKAEPGLGIIDSLSVRWEDNRSLNGIDGNKKIKGVKRHV